MTPTASTTPPPVPAQRRWTTVILLLGSSLLPFAAIALVVDVAISWLDAGYPLVGDGETASWVTIAAIVLAPFVVAAASAVGVRLSGRGWWNGLAVAAPLLFGLGFFACFCAVLFAGAQVVAPSAGS